MKTTEISPNIKQYVFRQEKGDKDYGSCLWAIFSFDLSNFSLLIISDCGDFSYMWPKSDRETFLHLMSRVRKNYLLEKFSGAPSFDLEASIKATIKNIKENEPEENRERVINQVNELKNREIMSEDEFEQECDDIFIYFGWNDKCEAKIIRTYPLRTEKIVDIFINHVQPLIKETIEKEKDKK